MSHKPEPKRAPRRLFSFDSEKSRRSSTESSSPTVLEPQRNGRKQSLPLVEEARSDSVTESDWYQQQANIGPAIPSPTDSRTASPGPDSPRQDSRKPGLAAPAARWQSLRAHVLPTPVLHQQQPSSASSVATTFSRPSTPKPSRLARLGFRQVVDHVREVDDTRKKKFAEDLQKICWSLRSPDVQKVKPERDASTGGSSLHLPFMSTASLVSAGSSTVNLTGNSKRNEQLRPLSIQTLAVSNRASLSLRPLLQMLTHNAAGTPPTESSVISLPYENLVLSTLLFPFLTPEKFVNADEEQGLAFETFTLLTGTWPPKDESANIERCLWCCDAGLIGEYPIRTRIIEALGVFMGQQQSVSMFALQTIAHGLFVLLAAVNISSKSQDLELVEGLITQLFMGGSWDLDRSSVEEEYGVGFAKQEDQEVLRKGILIESLMRCIEHCGGETGTWLLQAATQKYWIARGKITATSLLQVVESRKIATFCRASLTLLQPRAPSEQVVTITKTLARFLSFTVIKETEGLSGKIALEAKANVVRLILELNCTKNAEISQWATSKILHWYEESSEWETSIKKSFHGIVLSGDWMVITRILIALIDSKSDESRRPLFTFLLPLINDQLVETPPPYPSQEITAVFDRLSRLYPPLFYKPLFSCAASSKEFTVVNHLCTLATHSKFLADYWVRDAEMMSVALMSGAGENEFFRFTKDGLPWSQARLGQSVLLVELIGQIQVVRRAHDTNPLAFTNSIGETMRFVASLETRIAILLDAKERTSLVPPSQRMLFCILLREFRLLTKSIKSAPWLPRIVSWFIDFLTEGDIVEELEDEVSESVKRIQGLYVAAQDGVRHTSTRRSTMFLSPSLGTFSTSNSIEKGLDLSKRFTEHKTLIDSLSKGFPSKAMKLLVAMSSSITADDYRRLGPVLWAQGFDESDHTTTASACFLLMQCAEKTPTDILPIIEVDLQSSDAATRLDAVRKISILINWRFQIMSQSIIMDRTRRPFKLARAPLPFVATDMGSSLYVLEEEIIENEDTMPAELKRRLAEVGWGEAGTVVDQRQEWIRTPMSLLPTNQLDRLDARELSAVNSMTSNANSHPSPPRPASSNDNALEMPVLLRRNSSSGGPANVTRRRAVFVPSLAQILPRLASLVLDSDFVVAATARNIVMDLMRNDPALLTRPALDLLNGDRTDVSLAVSTFDAFLHIRKILPSAMAHNVFNNLAGFLKHSARQIEVPDTLQNFGLTIPILGKLVTQVSGMTIREIRRAKVEPFLIPSGSLWFSSTAPIGSMFPRGPSENPFEDAQGRLMSITLIRVSQNLLFLSMLKRNHQDVQLIRKNMSHLVLPSRTENHSRQLDQRDFIPRKQGSTFSKRGSADDVVRVLSMMLSRSYLLLIAQVFRSMSRHLSDRNELAVLIDGLNRILLAHGDDIGIVSQALIALMVAITRFRRLFTSGGGYSLFMPVLVKVYTESHSHTGIRLAIEYAINRFYALHRESFLFQSLDAVASIFALITADKDWCAKGIHDIFYSLQQGVSPSTPDAAGIHNANKLQEREALIMSTAEDKPQNFLNSMRRGDSQTGTSHVVIDIPEEYESKKLGMDDFVRLFLTVIAHDPALVRAEHFLHLLRFLAPRLYSSSQATRPIIRDSIVPLSHILAKNFARHKGPEGPTSRLNEESTTFLPPLETHTSEKSKSTSDVTSMRLDFVSLVIAVGQEGGQVSLSTARQIIDLTKIILRDVTHQSIDPLTNFFGAFIKSLLLQKDRPSCKAFTTFLRSLSPVIHAYLTTMDFSVVFKTVSELCTIPTYSDDLDFSQVVVSEICVAGLVACELAASENQLAHFPCRSALVSLLAKAIFLKGVDIISELEKRKPTYPLFAFVILPMVLELKTEEQLMAENSGDVTWRNSALGSSWIRLLFFAMSACQNSYRQESSKQDRSKSRERRRPHESPIDPQLPILITALLVVKVIIIRAETDLSKQLPGIWERLALFFKSMLATGNADFAFASADHSRSPSPSPSPSPRNSIHFEEPPRMASYLGLRPTSGDAILSRPRMIDYALWSVLEFVCVYRTPLRVQLRLFKAEKVLALDAELRNSHHGQLTLASMSRRASASVFSKPRRHLSIGAMSLNDPGVRSVPGSPRTSIAPPVQTSTPTPSPALLDIRRPGYQIQASPVSPSTQDNPFRQKILHLGPVSPTVLQAAPLSPSLTGSGGWVGISRSAKIRSIALAFATYKRIRAVQVFMGYTRLLPLPDDKEEEPILEAWTKRQAIAAVMKEASELVDEFEQALVLNDPNDESIVIVGEGSETMAS